MNNKHRILRRYLVHCSCLFVDARDGVFSCICSTGQHDLELLMEDPDFQMEAPSCELQARGRVENPSRTAHMPFLSGIAEKAHLGKAHFREKEIKRSVGFGES